MFLNFLTTMAPARKRMKYDAGFKLKVVEFAKKTNNCAAAREFTISEKLVRDWRKAEVELRKMPKTKCARRGGKAHWPELEDEVTDWVMENRQNGFPVTRNAIIIYALKWAKKNPEKSQNFKPTNSWCARFMERKDLVMRHKTKIAQKLPAELDKNVISFQRYVIKKRVEHQYALANIGNMDETPMNFDMPPNRTVNSKGSKTVLIKTRFTVVLACMADGTKLKPMVVFKRKTMPKLKLPAGVIVHVHPKGWMDEDGVKLWTDKVWKKRPGGLMKTKSLLVWDMFKAHVTEKSKDTKLFYAHTLLLLE